MESENKTNIVCLCGSLSFKQAFAAAELGFVLTGNLVLTPCCMYGDAQRTDNYKEFKGYFDTMHFRKIELCDEVYIVNVNGYIGASTQAEIEYATQLGKKIQYLEPIYLRK